MVSKTIYILGVGHSTPVSIDIALDCGYEVIGLYHYNSERTGEFVNGYKILGSFDDLLKNDLSGKNFVLSMGDNNIRALLLQEITSRGGRIPTMIHPMANISRFASISTVGVVIPAFCDIQANSVIEDNVMMGTGTVVCHNTIIGANSFIACHTVIGAYINVGKNVFFGLNCTCVSGKVAIIGDNAVVGAGCVVNRDVLANSVVVGNPNRAIR